MSSSQQTCEEGPSSIGSGTLAAFGLTQITTGYFSLVLAPPPVKCNHGLLLDPGIHKDAPGRPGHDSARTAAVAPTKDLVEQILDADGIAGNDKAIKAFMGVNGGIAFVIDDTGSMGSVINGVKNSVASIVNLVKDSEEKPDQYVLVDFGDPSVSTAFNTDSADALLSRVNQLRPSGGGDCPELAMTGALRAVNAVSSGSDLYLFTDASAKDSSLSGNVIAAARAKDITMHVFSFGSCSPIDPAFFAITSETGGQLFSLTQSTSETQKIFDLVNPSVTGNPTPLLISSGNLSGITPVKNELIVVDSSISKLIVSVALDNTTSIRLLKPNGEEVVDNSAIGTNITELSGGKLFIIDNPTTGNWSLAMSGTGIYNLSITANSSIEFKRFQFVEERGRSEHEGLFPIKGQPLAGVSFMGLANVFGDINNVEFELRTIAGEFLQPISTEQVLDSVLANDYLGAFSMPTDTFRVYMKGVNTAGENVERAYAATFRGQSVSVTPLGDGVAEIIAGQVLQQKFRVTNPTNCIFCIAPYLEDLQGDMFTFFSIDLIAIRAGVNSISLAVNDLGDGLGNASPFVLDSPLQITVRSSVVSEPSAAIVFFFGVITMLNRRRKDSRS